MLPSAVYPLRLASGQASCVEIDSEVRQDCDSPSYKGCAFLARRNPEIPVGTHPEP